MRTHNVNVAASESSKTWVKTPESVWFTRKTAALAELAQIEGDMMAYIALGCLDIEDEDLHEAMYIPMIAHDRIERLEAMGAINSPAVYEIVSAVDELITELDASVSPGILPTLEEYQVTATEKKAECMAEILESLKPFSVNVCGQMEYPEDDPVYGTYWRDESIHLGRAWTVAEAMDIAAAAWLEDEWEPREPGECYWDSDFGRDMGPVSFSPRTIVISDEQNRKVLTADAAGLEWNAHVTREEEISRLAAEKEALLREASQESSWDNFSTAKQLRAKAEATQAGVVDTAWQGHPDVADALAGFVRPDRITWGGRLNTRGLSRFMADDMTFLVSLSDRTCPASKNERYELVYGLALSIADHVSSSVTDWSTPRPKIPAAVIAAWLLTKEIVIALFGGNGEEIWSGIQGALKSRLREDV
ncbi:hypothetical protein WKG93_18525 [Pantoea agglomerans]|uniref:hypothetical protein n=1 Tax=Enterobacter agglomerans TaxID=549 RepID=UPI0023B1A5AA|nr:hypothetical protein [Pantoea agglomerans]WEC75175.1 hypothetical protein LDO72_23300 [Pantoea agglomerans]